MVDAYAEPTLVGRHVVDAVGRHLAQLRVDEVVHAHPLGLARGLPLAPCVLEVANEFLFLRVHRDDGLALALLARHRGGDVAKLRIAIGVLAAFAALAHRLQAVAELAQQRADAALAYLMASGAQFLGRSCRALAGPAQERRCIAPNRRLDQGIETVEQAGWLSSLTKSVASGRTGDA